MVHTFKFTADSHKHENDNTVFKSECRIDK